MTGTPRCNEDIHHTGFRLEKKDLWLMLLFSVAIPESVRMFLRHEGGNHYGLN